MLTGIANLAILAHLTNHILAVVAVLARYALCGVADLAHIA